MTGLKMLTFNSLIPIQITADELDICQRNGRLAEIGGRSQIRSDDRTRKLSEDQLVGQVSNLALAKFLYDNDRGMEEYIAIRQIANANPTRGDGGRDLIGLDIDIKGSLIRNKAKPLLEYNLLVRPEERHPNFVYVLGLVLEDWSGVVLSGWTYETSLPRSTETYGIFAGAFVVPAINLNAMRELTLEGINGYSAS